MTSPRFTLRQLEIFTAVARTGNITRAAEQLHLSASATSSAISELESAVGADLTIRRKGRGVRLTAQGDMFNRMATKLLADAGEMNVALEEEATDATHGTLRIGYFAPLGASFLPDLLQGFTTQHPAVKLELVEEMDDELHRRLSDGLLDVALGYEPSRNPSLKSVHVFSRRPFAIVAADHPLASRTTVSLHEIAKQPLIHIKVGPHDQSMTWFASVGITPKVRWETSNIDLMRVLVGRGLGYGVMMQRQRHSWTLDGFKLRVLEFDPPLLPVAVYLTTKQSAPRRKRVKAFEEFLGETVRNFPDWLGTDPPSADTGRRSGG